LTVSSAASRGQRAFTHKANALRAFAHKALGRDRAREDYLCRRVGWKVLGKDLLDRDARGRRFGLAASVWRVKSAWSRAPLTIAGLGLDRFGRRRVTSGAAPPWALPVPRLLEVSRRDRGCRGRWWLGRRAAHVILAAIGSPASAPASAGGTLVAMGEEGAAVKVRHRSVKGVMPRVGQRFACNGIDWNRAQRPRRSGHGLGCSRRTHRRAEWPAALELAFVEPLRKGEAAEAHQGPSRFKPQGQRAR